MPLALSLPGISTNVRFLDLAAAYAERAFLTPPRHRDAAAAALDLIDARQGFFLHKGRHIATYRWGGRDDPAVVLAHGWGGHAAQMRAFVFPLLAAGYRVIAYDQPAHGISEGRLTGLPDFADVLAELSQYQGHVEAVVAHSLAAPATALALASGRLRTRRVVLVSPPTDLVAYSRRFARWHLLPERVRRAMQSAIEERYGISWESLDVRRLAAGQRARALVIHDRDDRQVPWTQGARVAELWPGARLMSTDGLGHVRLLAAEPVTRAAADFISGRSAVASIAAEPAPAPLY